MADRPQGIKVLEGAALGQFSKVVVAKLDRWTRSTVAGVTRKSAISASSSLSVASKTISHRNPGSEPQASERSAPTNCSNK